VVGSGFRNTYPTLPRLTEDYFRVANKPGGLMAANETGYAKHHPEDALGIGKVLGFRKRVRAEFDRLVRESEKQAPVAVAGRPGCSASQLARLTP